LQKILFLFSIGGSGQHAVMRWLCKQAEPAIYYNNCTICSTEILHRNAIAEFVEDKAKNMRHNKCELQLDIEEYNLLIYNFINKSPSDHWDIETSFDKECLFSVVVRDHYNFVASRFSKGLKRNLEKMLDVWKKHILLCLEQPNNFIDINYNNWHSDKNYRISLCERLNIPFTDAGFYDVPFVGETKFDDKEYNNRWERYTDNKRYSNIVNNKELVELSKKYFNFVIE